MLVELLLRTDEKNVPVAFGTVPHILLAGLFEFVPQERALEAERATDDRGFGAGHQAKIIPGCQKRR